MPLTYNAIPIFEYNTDSPAVLIGNLEAAGYTATIKVWKKGVELVLDSDACIEIDNTGFYSWSTSNLPISAIDETFNQFHYQMIGDADPDHVFDGDFILKLREDDGHMPDSMEDMIQRA